MYIYVQTISYINLHMYIIISWLELPPTSNRFKLLSKQDWRTLDGWRGWGGRAKSRDRFVSHRFLRAQVLKSLKTGIKKNWQLLTLGWCLRYSLSLYVFHIPLGVFCLLLLLLLLLLLALVVLSAECSKLVGPPELQVLCLMLLMLQVNFLLSWRQ